MAPHARPCPACSATRGRLLHRNALAPLDDLDLGYDVVACDACGMVYGDAIPDAATYARYYTGYSKYDVVDDPARVPPLTRDQVETAAAFLAPHLAPATRIVDVGCSIGVLLDALKRRGFAHVSGLDPAPRAREVARRLFDVDVRTGMLDDAFDASDADLVMLVQVLEHLPDPRAALGAIARTLPAGGLLFLEVPAADRFHTLAGEWLGELSHEHINFFGRASLAGLVARLGFVEVACAHVTFVNGLAGLRGLYRLDPGAAPADPAPDAATLPSMVAYLDRAAGHRERFEAILAPYLGRPLAVWGAGAHTARMLAQTSLGRADVPFIVDGNLNLRGKRLGGRPIGGRELLADRPGLPVLVSSYLAQAAIAADLATIADHPAVVLYPDGV